MFESTFDLVMRAIKQWVPEKQYSTESKYRDDLIEFLRKRLKSREEGILGLSSSEQHLIRKEAGRHLADIGIDEKIGIELKLNLKKQSQLDRLCSQVRRFLREYSYLIVVLCGDTDQEKLDALRYEFREYTKPSLLAEKVVKIIPKSKSKGSKKRRRTKPKRREEPIPSLVDVLY